MVSSAEKYEELHRIEVSSLWKEDVLMAGGLCGAMMALLAKLSSDIESSDGHEASTIV